MGLQIEVVYENDTMNFNSRIRDGGTMVGQWDVLSFVGGMEDPMNFKGRIQDENTKVGSGMEYRMAVQ